MNEIHRETLAGQPSFRFRTREVDVALTEMGGHMAPVRFFPDSNGPFEPYRIADWSTESFNEEIPFMLKCLRGDFFCLPFGGNEQPWNDEKHPPHGETAAVQWNLDDTRQTPEGAGLYLSIRTVSRPGVVRKRLLLVESESVIYSRHDISDMTGPMCFGHHPTLAFPDKPGNGLISVSPFAFGQVYPGEFEHPEEGGYSILKPGATFSDLSSVERLDGKQADLTRYPARRGFEDLVMVCSDPEVFPAWSAVTYSDSGMLWFALKDPGVLASTILWHDNGGRHYPPWNGRSVNTLGVEDVTAYFHEGLAASVSENPLSRKGIRTHREFSPSESYGVYYIQGVTRVPAGFGRVSQVIPKSKSELAFRDKAGGETSARVRWGFLKSGRVGIPDLDD